MILLFIILQFIGSIALWLTITSTIRTLKLKKDFSLIISLILSIVFLIMAMRLSIMFPMYYLICAIIHSLYVLFIVVRDVNKSKFSIIINTVSGFCFWPQSICYNLFLYSISDVDKKNI